MFILSNQRDSNLWIHVVEDTEHPSLVRTRWDVTKVVGPLDFFVPESVWEPKSDLCQRKKENISTQIRKTTSHRKRFLKNSSHDLLYDPSSQTVDRFLFPLRKWRMELNQVLLE